MNDIVFAGKLANCNNRAQKYNKCLKVLLADCNGGRADDKCSCGSGGYVIIPPYSPYDLTDRGDKGLIVCIEQPLIPSPLPPKAVTAQGDGMLNALKEAVYRFEKGGAAGVLAALGQLIVSYVAEEYSVNLHPVVKSLKADMEKNFTDSSYSAETAIRKLPLNYDYVRKLFKKETGITPLEYLNGLRMDRAKDCILNGIANNYSRYTVSQIAEACGFAEPLYFSRVFKKHFGVSPLQYAADNGRR